MRPIKAVLFHLLLFPERSIQLFTYLVIDRKYALHLFWQVWLIVRISRKFEGWEQNGSFHDFHIAPFVFVHTNLTSGQYLCAFHNATTFAVLISTPILFVHDQLVISLNIWTMYYMYDNHNPWYWSTHKFKSYFGLTFMFFFLTHKDVT